VHLVDPLSGQIGKRGKVLGPGQPLGLEAAHLAGRGGGSLDRSCHDFLTALAEDINFVSAA
jgi:hypothetical protein